MVIYLEKISAQFCSWHIFHKVFSVFTLYSFFQSDWEVSLSYTSYQDYHFKEIGLEFLGVSILLKSKSALSL